MTVIRWTKPAIQHLVEIREYIAKDSPAAGSRVASAIREQVKALALHPEIGRKGLLEGTRELVISRLPYLVVYQPDGVGLVSAKTCPRRHPDRTGHRHAFDDLLTGSPPNGIAAVRVISGLNRRRSPAL